MSDGSMLRWFSASVPLEPAGARRRRIELLGWLGVIVVAAIAHAGVSGAPIFPVDDAYITLHNVRVLLSGQDSNFPGVSPFAGATSSVHLLVVAALALILGAPWSLWLAGWLATALYAMGAVRLAHVLEAPRAVVLLLPFVALACGDTLIQLVNGLETGLAMAAVAWSLALHLDPDARHRRWLPALLGTMPFLRPELALLSAALIGDRALQETGWPGRARRLALDVALAAAFAAPWCLLNVVTTGGLIPATISVKQNYFAEGCKSIGWRTTTVTTATRSFLGRLGIVSTGLALLALRRCGQMLLLAVAIFVGSYWKAFPGALAHFDHRYLHVLVPLAILGLAIAATESQMRLRRWGLLLLTLALVTTALALPAALERYEEHLEKDTLASAEVSRFIAQRLAGTPKLLVHDIGFLSNSLPNELVDIVGLKNPRAATLHGVVTWRTCGQARPLVFQELAVQSGATYLVALDDWDRIYRISGNFRNMSWQLEPLRPAGARYQVYRLTPPPIVPRLQLTAETAALPPGVR